MSETIIKIENVSKQYRLGAIGGGTLKGDIQSFMARIRGKEDPNSKIGAAVYEKNEKFLALQNINLEIKKGEAVGIIGHNGAGKSTLLKLLTRVTAPTTGQICMNGRVASMLEVGTGFHPELTGRENVYLNGAILGMTKAEIDKKFDEIVEFSEVKQFIDTPVKRYSSGMYVKLAFSVAAHLDSEIMIMDEVLAVGDVKFQQKCLDKMSEAAHQNGRTVLYVSHNMSTIRRLCDRCIVLDHGKVVFDGDVDEAINIYTQELNMTMKSDIDLGQNRMDYLPTEFIAKMIRLTTEDKRAPVYEMNEHVRFDLQVDCKQDINNACLRLELRSVDDTTVGTTFVQKFASLKAGVNTLEIDFDSIGLIPGKYLAAIIFYQINSVGASDDLDGVYPALIFEIQDTRGRLGINWNYRSWGRIKLPEINVEVK